MSKVKLLLIFIIPLFFVGGWAIYQMYQYYCDFSLPCAEIIGLEENHYYSGEIACLVKGSDSYKVQDMSVWLDDNILVNEHKIQKNKFEYSFVLPTQALSNGMHTLRIYLRDASYLQNSITKTVSFIVDNAPLQVSLMSEGSFKVLQGGTLHVKFKSNKKLKEALMNAYSEKDHFCFPESENSLIYECFVPIAIDAEPNEHSFDITTSDYAGNTVVLESNFHILPYAFKTEYFSIARGSLQSENLQFFEDQFEKDMVHLIEKSLPKKLWRGIFYIPCDIRGISREFGTLLVNDNLEYRYKGLDIVAPPHSAVWASQDGIVALKEHYEYSGNTVVLDHGLGIQTIYFHLAEFSDIKIGDFVKKGKLLGKLGNTGYTTGYHLHFQLRIGKQPVNPLQWTKNDF